MRPTFRLLPGFSAIELLIALTLTGTIAAISLPITSNTLADFRLSGDAHAIANSVAVTKMRAASLFSTARLYIDLSGRTYHMEIWQRTGTPAWVVDGGSTVINSRNTLSFGIVASAPPNTQGTIGQAAACLDAAGHAIAQTACLVFNSRGIPVDSTGAPTGAGAVYVSSGAGVWGITVSATGQTQLWRTFVTATPAWTLQ